MLFLHSSLQKSPGDVPQLAISTTTLTHQSEISLYGQVISGQQSGTSEIHALASMTSVFDLGKHKTVSIFYPSTTSQRRMAPRINLSTRWMWTVNSTPVEEPHAHSTEGWVGSKAGQEAGIQTPVVQPVPVTTEIPWLLFGVGNS
jgi:hypothetical protein